MPRSRAKSKSPPDFEAQGFLRSASLRMERVPSFDRYPFSIPAVRRMGELALHPKVTFFVGDNGCGKSTLIEAIAIAAGFNPEGGSKSFRFSARPSESSLEDAMQLMRGIRREIDGFFLRAESFFNLATMVDKLQEERGGLIDSYGGRSLHEQSHGESFLALVMNRFRPNSLYILDEPEAALSPTKQLSLLGLIDRHVQRGGSQFLIATHSPILMAYPDALLYHLSEEGIAPLPYEETEHFQVTSAFMADRARFFRRLFE